MTRDIINCVCVGHREPVIPRKVSKQTFTTRRHSYRQLSCVSRLTHPIPTSLSGVEDTQASITVELDSLLTTEQYSLWIKKGDTGSSLIDAVSIIRRNRNPLINLRNKTTTSQDIPPSPIRGNGRTVERLDKSSLPPHIYDWRVLGPVSDRSKLWKSTYVTGGPGPLEKCTY